MKKKPKESLASRLTNLENRLEEYGIDMDAELTLHDETFNAVHPQEAAERLLILLAVAVTAYNFEDSEKVMDWLKREQLWKAVSPKEKEFFRDPAPADEEQQDLSWRFEGAYILAWALEIVPTPPDPARECNEEQIAQFSQHVPAVGSTTEEFFSGLDFTRQHFIVDEHLFYQYAVSYLNNLSTRHKENTSKVHVKAATQRHMALNWLLKGKNSDWDAIAAVPVDL
jgi:Domain of unknown function (DUF4272)